MLFGDWTRYATLVFGLSFSVLLITQQTAIFLGILLRSTGPLQNIGQADIWVASEYTYYVDQMRPLRDKQLGRVRTTPGVEWAEPFFFFYAMVQLSDGSFTIVNVVGIDRMSMIGQPPVMIEGRLEDLRSPDSIVVDDIGRKQLNNVNVGDVIRLQDRRAVVVGICRAKRGLLSKPLVYTTFDNATQYVPLRGQRVSYLLTKVKPGSDVDEVCASINRLPDLWAFTADQMRWQSIRYILTETGIGINFGVTVMLGLIVGLVVSPKFTASIKVPSLLTTAPVVEPLCVTGVSQAIVAASAEVAVRTRAAIATPARANTAGVLLFMMFSSYMNYERCQSVLLSRGPSHPPRNAPGG